MDVREESFTKRFSSFRRLEFFCKHLDHPSAFCKLNNDKTACSSGSLAQEGERSRSHNKTCGESEKQWRPDVFPCTKCDLTFSTQELLEFHSYLHHGDDGGTDTREVNGLPLPTHSKDGVNLTTHENSSKDYEGDAPKGDSDSNRDSNSRSKDEGPLSYTCTQCGKVFHQSAYLKKHMKFHESIKPYECSLCHKTFGSTATRKIHMRTHSEERPYRCSVCDKSFVTSSKLQRHVRTHVGDKPYQCLVCRKAFSDGTNLTKHMRVHNGDKPYKCTLCDKTFGQSGSLQRHKRIHDGDNKPYECSLCDNKAFCSLSNLQRHLRIHDDEKSYACSVCNKSFITSSSLERHMKAFCKLNNDKTACSSGSLTQDGERSRSHNKTCGESEKQQWRSDVFPCTQCDLTFSTQELLEFHSYLHHGDDGGTDTREVNGLPLPTHSKDGVNLTTHENSSKDYEGDSSKGDTDSNRDSNSRSKDEGPLSYTCTQCGKVFRQSMYLKKHMKFHESIKPYECSLCHKTFGSTATRKIHMRTHSEERPYRCSVCDKSFVTSSKLQRHVRTHVGEKPYQCVVCRKAFSDGTNLTKHMRVHNGDKPYKCTLCDKAFGQSSSLQRHKRIHDGDNKPYECSLCDNKAFCSLSNLQRHLRIHDGEKPYVCSVCNKSFITSSSLERHMKVHMKLKHYI